MNGPFKSHGPGSRPPFERIALLLQGGGALGAYQAGVYQALSEAKLDPDWVAGISIGAINSALIAGNPRERRVERLREFWDTVSQSPLGIPYDLLVDITDKIFHFVFDQVHAMNVVLFGAPGFFTPRLPPLNLASVRNPAELSLYDVASLKRLLERLVDFDLLNSGTTRFSAGAVNVKTGNFAYFDNTTHKISPAHVMASGSLPPGFPATEVDGEFYWDGGLVSNTPLQWVFDARPHQDTLAFQIDLWNARGELPRNLVEADARQKDIRYSSRTRAGTDAFHRLQALRRAAAKLLEQIPAALRQTPEAELLGQEANTKVYSIIHMIYRARNYESASKDYDFSRRTMEEHWKAGYDDMIRTLGHPEVLQRPQGPDGVVTFDLAVPT